MNRQTTGDRRAETLLIDSSCVFWNFSFPSSFGFEFSSFHHPGIPMPQSIRVAAVSEVSPGTGKEDGSAGNVMHGEQLKLLVFNRSLPENAGFPVAIAVRRSVFGRGLCAAFT